MKKLNLSQNYAFFNKAQKITSILLIFVSAMFIANSCTKENELSKEDAMQLRTEMTPEQRVAAFTPIVSGTFDPDKTYTGQEAVLGVETVLNYEYGDFSKQFDETYSLKDTFTVAKEGGIITDRVVSEIYNQALQLMKCHYASIVEANKVELLSDLNLVSENSSQMQVGLNNVVGNVAAFPKKEKKRFSTGEDWHAIDGKCNDPAYPSNAPEEIEKAVNLNLVGLYLGPPIWYSDIEGVQYDEDDYWWAKNENDPTPNDFIIDYHEWRVWGIGNSGGYAVFCIENDEMNYYLANAEYEAKRYEPILGKTFININMWADQISCVDCSNPQMWRGLGKYGKKNTRPPDVAVKKLGPCEEQLGG